MKKNIGLFDMALALSVTKINSQFKELMYMKVVPDKWGLLSDKNGNKFLNDSDNFDKNLAGWKAAFDTTIAAEIEKLKQQKWAEEDKPTPDEALINNLQKQIDKLERQSRQSSSAFKDYDCALNAHIESFRVKIIKNDSSRLLFIVSLGDSVIYSKEYNEVLKAQEIKEVPFKGCKYAFKVRISDKLVTTEDMAKHLSDADKKMLITEGIKDDVFTIESLFMDFQNSNISTYEKDECVFPDKMVVWFQLMLTNYFINVKNDKNNPFILGFKVKLKKEQLKESLFMPTAITHSTTYSATPRAEALNFLMQTDDRVLPQDLTRGSLPKSLIESVVDTSTTINGLFAIDYKTFVEKYVEKNLYSEIFNVMAKSFNDNKKFKDDGYSASASSVAVNCRKSGIWFDLKLDSRRISVVPRSEQEKQGIKISWDIVVDGSIHIEKERKIIFVDTSGTSATDWAFSTSGAYPIDKKVGKKGNIILTLTTNTDGKLDVKSQFIAPTLGTNTKQPVYESDWDKLFDIFIDLLNPLGILGAALMNIFRDDTVSVNFNSLVGGISLSDFSAFSSRVILPGSNTFTFKTVRLLTNQQDEDDAVIFDIAYATKA